ncbi:PLD nuclease N-terminal domain-containing protein [Dethiothermospora halolimnae]|uniref:PLD nuclease N-terminal domain-containing protein n=1 Tax=Dethiothermospora halolimnae TaxID=3114390 RepID=UPI003CCBE525
MFEGLTTMEIIKLLLPLIILEFGLKILCITLIFRKGVRSLSKPIWLLIVLLVSTFGPIGYLLFGRRRY